MRPPVHVLVGIHGSLLLSAPQNGAQFTAGFLTLLLLAYINTRFVMAATVREVLVAWSSSVVDRVCDMATDGFRQETSVLVSPLSYVLPREATLAAILRSVYKSLIEPSMRYKDVLAAQLDGYGRSLTYRIVSPLVLCESESVTFFLHDTQSSGAVRRYTRHSEAGVRFPW